MSRSGSVHFPSRVENMQFFIKAGQVMYGGEVHFFRIKSLNFRLSYWLQKSASKAFSLMIFKCATASANIQSYKFKIYKKNYFFQKVGNKVL